MAFPEFEKGKKKVLFFSRGRGRGHAVPDVEITKELERLDEGFQVRLASYATGAETINELGYPVFDLELPAEAPQSETTILAGKLIAWLDPDVVVAHEEFPAILTAKIFDKPVIFITDWFVDPTRQSMAALRFADEIFFIDEEGSFPEPPYLKGRVRYVGPILRDFEYTRDDRARARGELGIPAGASTVAMLPGSWTEEKAPLYDLVIAAFDLLEGEKWLVWVAGSEADLIRNRAAGRSDILVIGFDPVVERIMAAADVAVTKGTRMTALELAAMGVPSISLSRGLNSLDDERVSRIPTNVHRMLQEVTPQELAELAHTQTRLPLPARSELPGRQAVAEIAAAISRAS